MRKEKKQVATSQVATSKELSFNEVMAQIKANRKKAGSSSKGKGNAKSKRN